MSYRLWYFPFRGRGEQIRLLLNALEQPYEDVAVKRADLPALKQQGPGLLAFGSLPLLEDDDFRLVQGPVIMSYLARKHGMAPTDLRQGARADAITLGAEDLRTRYFSLFGEGAQEKQAAFLSGDWQTRWLPSFDGLLALHGAGGFFLGSTPCHADLAVWDVLDAVTTYIPGATLDGHPRLSAFCDAVRALPPVAAYLARRPPT
jgi:glutathione S-transferase